MHYQTFMSATEVLKKIPRTAIPLLINTATDVIQSNTELFLQGKINDSTEEDLLRGYKKLNEQIEGLNQAGFQFSILQIPQKLLEAASSELTVQEEQDCTSAQIMLFVAPVLAIAAAAYICPKIYNHFNPPRKTPTLILTPKLDFHATIKQNTNIEKDFKYLANKVNELAQTQSNNNYATTLKNRYHNELGYNSKTKQFEKQKEQPNINQVKDILKKTNNIKISKINRTTQECINKAVSRLNGEIGKELKQLSSAAKGR